MRYMNTLVNERKHRDFKMIANICPVNATYDLTILQRMYLQQVRGLATHHAGLGVVMMALVTSTGQPALDVVESNRAVFCGLPCWRGDLLALNTTAAVGILAEKFIKHGEVCVVGYLCHRVRKDSDRSSIWRHEQVLSWVPIRNVLARCTWTEDVADRLLVLSNGV